MTKPIIFSDVDGTLLNSSHQISEETIQAIRALKLQDLPFVIVSARSPSGIYPILQKHQLSCPIIAYSGALILDEDRNILDSHGFDRVPAQNVLSFIDTQSLDLCWNLYALDQWIVKDKTDPRVITEETVVKAQSVQGSFEMIEGDVFHKILCIGKADAISELEKRLIQSFSELSIAKSSQTYLEIMAGGITKAAAVKTLCSLWNLDLKQAVAFGDNYNDIEMLETVGHGYLMGNAPEALKQRFSRHTDDHDHDGIVSALLDLNLSQRSE